MTPEQAAAFVHSQSVCAQAHMAAMHAENHERDLNGHTHAHDFAAFQAVPDEFGISSNAVISLFKEANW